MEGLIGGLMESQGTQRLPGMRDLFEEEYRRNRRVQDGLQSFLALYGYRTVDTPVVEIRDSTNNLVIITEVPGGHPLAPGGRIKGRTTGIFSFAPLN